VIPAVTKVVDLLSQNASTTKKLALLEQPNANAHAFLKFEDVIAQNLRRVFVKGNRWLFVERPGRYSSLRMRLHILVEESAFVSL
jgi:hypothetical protein